MPANEESPADDLEPLLDRVAAGIVARGLGAPAVLFLEGTRPLHFVGAHAFAAFEPLLQAALNREDLRRVRVALENRDTAERLLAKIEALEARRRGVGEEGR